MRQGEFAGVEGCYRCGSLQVVRSTVLGQHSTSVAAALVACRRCAVLLGCCPVIALTADAWLLLAAGGSAVSARGLAASPPSSSSPAFPVSPAQHRGLIQAQS
jgi:hypothetical protein